MWRLCFALMLLAGAMAVVAGCKSDGSWDEVAKDWNGDNMKMRSSANFKSLEQPKLQP
jgi:hypothetical protein